MLPPKAAEKGAQAPMLASLHEDVTYLNRSPGQK